MPTKHVIAQIEAYVDQTLPQAERQRVEAHLALCPTCVAYLTEARRLASELSPTLLATLGRPLPPPALRYRVRDQLDFSTGPRPRRVSLPWAFSGRLLNAAGTVTVIALLAFGAVAVIQSQLPGSNLVLQSNTLQANFGGDDAIATATLPASPTEIAPVTPTPELRPAASAGDSLPRPTPAPGAARSKEQLTLANQEAASPGLPLSDSAPIETSSYAEPQGAITFSFFNPAPHRQVYEIHLIEADGSNHRLFPLEGVSEPALRYSDDGLQIAFRAWSEPTTPRSLLSSNLQGDTPVQIGGFFEDAQPDWSPTENRLIFASQRESDRRWRLYTSWGNGLAEKELRREGKSPSFGPDGYRFVFESCDNTGNRCGLWLGNLDDSEYGSQPLLENPQAQAPDWSPVGEQIVYMANPDDNWDLFLINSDGSGSPLRLTDDPAIDGLPVWSPDGEWLAFLSDRGGNWGVWLLQVNSGELRQIFSFDGGIFTPPVREPYGERTWWDEQLSWSQTNESQ